MARYKIPNILYDRVCVFPYDLNIEFSIPEKYDMDQCCFHIGPWCGKDIVAIMTIIREN